ncbi:hypothetical protein QWY97_14280 [Vibrio cortegadensis]|uniref:hypothetical protein n=1 Tax=Vibrio cortegadensis TaxID=1328770 RepID=UPI0021C28C58|nr:hypothetical protein [Vibrio cortegadensis]MDN3698504.1 hypothetical protein [Vibrio cortegadensis]
MNIRKLSGMLFLLSFMGCSTVETTPTNTSPSTVAADPDKAEIETWIDKSILAPEGLSIEQNQIKYLTGSVDLNRDGDVEHLVLIQDRYFCGSGGCTAVMFDSVGKVINRITVARTPITLANSYRNGWQDFIVWSNGAYRLMSYNGESYPSNPSLEPKIDRETSEKLAQMKVAETELYAQDGYDLQPADSTVLWTPAETYYFTFKHYGDPFSFYDATVNLESGEIDIVITAKSESDLNISQ